MMKASVVIVAILTVLIAMAKALPVQPHERQLGVCLDQDVVIFKDDHGRTGHGGGVRRANVARIRGKVQRRQGRQSGSSTAPALPVEIAGQVHFRDHHNDHQ